MLNDRNTTHTAENRRILQIPSYNVKKMNIELSEDPWRPMAMKRRHSDTASSFVANGDVDDIPFENGEINFCEKDKKEEEGNVRTYKRRFYILFVFSLSSFAQYCAWNAFGPISGTTKAVFGWGNAEIALLASLDPITYILTILFFSWLMDVKGLRISLVLSLFLMFVGVGLRCVTRDHNLVIWSMTIGQFLNGLGGPVVQAGAPLLSSAWFPRKERTTATAIASLCGSFGVALSFLIGPNMVGDVPMDTSPTLSGFSDLSSNYSFLAQNLYLNTSLPLSETLYKDANHYWPIDKPNPVSNQSGISVRNTRETRVIQDHKGHVTGNVVYKVRYVAGPLDVALETDGKNGYVNLGNFINTCLGRPTLCSSGMTVSMWIKYESANEVQYFLGTSGSHSGQPGFVVYQDPRTNGSDNLAVSVRTGEKSWTLSVKVPSDTWTHVLFTWSPREGLTIHTNGTVAGSSKEFVATSPLDNARTTFTLGRANDQFKLSAAAYDDISVWYHVLTNNEVKAIYARLSGIDFAKLVDNKNSLARQEILKVREDEIMRLMYIEFGVVAVLFVCALVYFPDRPPTAPSISASAEREDFTTGIKQLLKHKQFWTLSMIYGITTGIYSGWGAVLALNLEGFGIGQNQASWIGFYATIAGIIAGISLARFSDFFGGHMKTLLLFLFVCSSGAFLWFSLLCLKIIPFSEASIYPSGIIGGFSISGTIPLFYELTVECTYPIAEGVTTGVLTLVNNIWTFAFLIVVMFPGIGTTWMNWSLFASCICCIPILLCLKERYGRLIVDNGIEIKVTASDANEEEGFNTKSKSIFSSTMSITRVDQIMERLYKSKESKL